MPILFTNDDGIESAGLHALVTPSRGAGHDLIVVAPHQKQSGASAAIGDLYGNGDIRYDEPEISGLARVPAVALHGPSRKRYSGSQRRRRPTPALKLHSSKKVRARRSSGVMPSSMNPEAATFSLRPVRTR